MTERDHVMEPTRDDLLKHDDWAHHALHVMDDLPDRGRRNLLLHLFRTVALCNSTGDAEAALRLCAEVESTVKLRGDESFVKVMDNAEPPNRDGAVSIKEVLAELSAHR